MPLRLPAQSPYSSRLLPAHIPTQQPQPLVVSLQNASMKPVTLPAILKKLPNPEKSAGNRPTTILPMRCPQQAWHPAPEVSKCHSLTWLTLTCILHLPCHIQWASSPPLAFPLLRPTSCLDPIFILQDHTLTYTAHTPTQFSNPRISQTPWLLPWLLRATPMMTTTISMSPHFPFSTETTRFGRVERAGRDVKGRPPLPLSS